MTGLVIFLVVFLLVLGAFGFLAVSQIKFPDDRDDIFGDDRR